MLRSLLGPTGCVVFILLNSLSPANSQTMVEPAVVGKANVITVASSQAKTDSVGREKLRIGSGDLLEVSIYGVPDFKQEARVNDSGEISLPLAGAVKVGGTTVEDAQEAIAKVLVDGGYFRDPHVSVAIKDFASQGVSVLGEVAKPGVYPVMGTRRLYDLFSLAGGLTNKAGKLVSITHRDRPSAPESVMMSTDPAKSVENNVEVFPGDTIVVSKAGIVYVVGDVQRPGGFVMENNERMTVLEALALAQGTNRTAALNSARILRRTPSGPEEVKIPLKQIMAAKANDMDLQADDILFVPGSAAKNAFSRGIESVFQVATGMAVYGIH